MRAWRKSPRPFQILVDDPPLAFQVAEWFEEALAACENFRGLDGLPLAGGQVVRGDAHADDGYGWCQWCFL
jgi:hypothetical protein